MPLTHPILVVSYSNESRAALEASLLQQEVASVPCATFVEAENWARQASFNGILVDLTSIIKARGEEKIVAYSLTGLYPTLRVRTIGTMLVPMIMPGGAKQEGSLKDFLQRGCAAFVPRPLRAHRRHEVCLPAVLRDRGKQSHTFTLNLSWGGAFLVDVAAERWSVGEELEIMLPEFDLSVAVLVRRVQKWGGRRVPGAGCQFLSPDASLNAVLRLLLKSSPDQDRDRVIG